jgi:hypothetical protein
MITFNGWVLWETAGSEMIQFVAFVYFNAVAWAAMTFFFTHCTREEAA